MFPKTFLAFLLVALGAFLGYVLSIHLGLFGHAQPSVVSADGPARTPRKAGDKPAEKAPRKGKKPNIVFMLADNLGWGELGCYGGGALRALRRLGSTSWLARGCG